MKPIDSISASIIVGYLMQVDIEAADRYLTNANDDIVYGIAEALDIVVWMDVKSYTIYQILFTMYGADKADAYAHKKQAEQDGVPSCLTVEEIIDCVSQLPMEKAHDYLVSIQHDKLSGISNSLGVCWDVEYDTYNGTIHEIMYDIFGQKIHDFYDNTDNLTLTPKSEIPRKKDGIMKSDNDLKVTAIIDGLMELDSESARKFLTSSKVQDSFLSQIAKEVGADWVPNEYTTINNIIRKMYSNTKEYKLDIHANFVVEQTNDHDVRYVSNIEGNIEGNGFNEKCEVTVKHKIGFLDDGRVTHIITSHFEKVIRKCVKEGREYYDTDS